MSLRLFTAIDLTADARDQLSRSIDTLRETLRAGAFDDAFRWVAPGNLHLTLRFLGNADAETAARIVQAMREPIRLPPMPLVFGRLGTFPARGRPRVLHAAVEQGVDALSALRDELDARLAAVCTWDAETRPFAPHLTLARSRDSAQFNPIEFSRLLESIEWPAVVFRAGAVTLFSSRTLPAGPEYTAEAQAALISE